MARINQNIETILLSEDIRKDGRRLSFKTRNRITFDFDEENDLFLGNGRQPAAFVGNPSTAELSKLTRNGYKPKRVASEDITIEIYDPNGDKFYQQDLVLNYYIQTRIDPNNTGFISQPATQEQQIQEPQFDLNEIGEGYSAPVIGDYPSAVAPPVPLLPPSGFLGFAEFDGDDELESTGSLPVSGTDAFTLEMRFRTHVDHDVDNTFNDGSRVMLRFGEPGGEFGGLLNGFDSIGSENAFRVFWQGGQVTGTTLLNDNIWHTATIVKPANSDGSDIKLYIDGVEETFSYTDTDTIIDISGSDGSPFRVGPDYIGHLDELRVWDVLRTESEISNNWDSPLVGDENNLIRYYRFDDGEIPVPAVVGGNNNDLIIATGSPRLVVSQSIVSESISRETVSGKDGTVISSSLATPVIVSGSELLEYSSSMDSISIVSGSEFFAYSSSVVQESEDITVVTASNISSLDFSGTNDNINYGPASFITDNLDAFGVSFWVESIETEQEELFGTLNDSLTTGIILDANTDETNAAEVHNLRLFIRAEDGRSLYGAMSSPPSLFNARWNHVFIQRTGPNTIEFWINGVQYATTYGNQGSPFTYSDGFQYDFVFGALNNRGNISNFFNGALDEFTFIRGATDASVIQEYYRTQRWKFLDTLELWSKFDSGSAGTVADNILDYSGNGRTGIASGSVEYIANIPYKGTGSIEFPSHSFDSYIEAPSIDAGQGDYTYEVWFKTDRTPASTPFELVSERLQSVGGTENSQSFALRMNSAGQIEHFIRDAGGTEYSASTAGAFNDDNWHRAVARRSGSSINVSVLAQGTDAIEENVNETATANTVTTGSSKFLIGIFNNGTVTGNFDGWIDDVRVWDDYRTDTEISSSNSVELSGSEAGLLWYSTLNNAEVVDLVSGSNGVMNYVRGSNRSPF